MAPSTPDSSLDSDTPPPSYRSHSRSASNSPVRRPLTSICPWVRVTSVIAGLLFSLGSILCILAKFKDILVYITGHGEPLKASPDVTVLATLILIILVVLFGAIFVWGIEYLYGLSVVKPGSTEERSEADEETWLLEHGERSPPPAYEDV